MGSTLVSTRCDYHLRWDGRSTRLGVKLDYTAVSSDSTVFLFNPSSMGGQSDLFPLLEGITAGPTDRLQLVASGTILAFYTTHTHYNPNHISLCYACTATKDHV